MTKATLEDEYFEWMYQFICKDRYLRNNSYRKLLTRLHDTEFTYILPKDANRAEDGISLRWRFAHQYDDPDFIMDCLSRPCSVFEMILALAIRCEEDIMDNTEFGNRIGQWFWRMIVNLGLGPMTDINFDREYTDDVIQRFLDRDFEPDGRGSLFTVRNCDRDLRDVEIWTCMLWYLDSIT